MQPLAFTPFSGVPTLGSVSPQSLLMGALYMVILYWFFYTLVAVYHWLTYSHQASIAVPAIVLHVFVSIVLIGYIVSGLY